MKIALVASECAPFAKTSGLADTVRDWHEFQSHGQDIGNGFSFSDATGSALSETVKRAIDSFHIPDEWKKIQLNGMTQDFSWESSAKKYVHLYEHSIRKR